VKKHLSRSFATAGLSLLILLASAGQAVAATSAASTSTTNNANTLKISPVRSDLTAKPGTSAKVDMTVTNLTAAPLMIHPIENDFVQGDETGTPALILDENSYAPTHSLKRFMAPLSNVTIPAHGMQTITLTINVPANAGAGGYYGAVRFAPVSADGSKSVNLNASAASLVLLTVPGKLVEQLNLTNFDVQQKGDTATSFHSPNNLDLLVRFENKGNVQSAPFGQVYVKKGDKVLYTADFNQQQPHDEVLPDGARRWVVPLKDLGKFGKYTIGGTFSYGTTNKSVEITKTIWIIPTAYIFGGIFLLVLLALVIFGFITFLRSYKRRILRQSRRRY
jgi:hypothetical protein